MQIGSRDWLAIIWKEPGPQAPLWYLIQGRVLGRNMQRLLPGNLKKKITSHTDDIPHHLWGFGFGGTWHPSEYSLCVCQLWTGLLFWKPVPVSGDSDAWWQGASNGADKYESEAITFHYLYTFWHKTSILENGDLADGMGPGNKSKSHCLPREKTEKEWKKENQEGACAGLWGSWWDNAINGRAGAWGMKDLPGRKDETECTTAAFAKWGL